MPGWLPRAAVSAAAAKPAPTRKNRSSSAPLAAGWACLHARCLSASFWPAHTLTWSLVKTRNVCSCTSGASPGQAGSAGVHAKQGQPAVQHSAIG